MISLQMKTELIAGIAEEVILDFAEVGQYDLMVVGIHSKDESENWFGRFMTEIISKAHPSYKRNINTSLFKPCLTKELLFRLEIPMHIFHQKLTN